MTWIRVRIFSMSNNVLIFYNKMSVLRAKGLTETWIPYYQFEVSVDFSSS